MTLLERLGLHRKDLRAWAMYDWANSAMVTTIVTAVFPIYFARVAAADLDPTVATQRLADATTIGLAIIAILSPILGAIADRAGVKKKLLGISLLIGVAAVGMMFFIERGDWQYAAVLFIIANIAVNASYVCYDSFLPHLAAPDEMDRVSTAGYALGYVGGGILLALNLAWIQHPAWFGLPSGPNLTPSQTTLPTRLAFLSVGGLVAGLFDPAVPPRPGTPRHRRRHHQHRRCPQRTGRHLPSAGRVPPGGTHAARVPDLQRRDRHDHPHGHDLRHRTRHRDRAR